MHCRYKCIEEKLLFSIYDNLNEKDLDTGVVRTLVSGIQLVYSMAYDHKEEYMYVPNYSYGDIQRYFYHLSIFINTSMKEMLNL